MAAKSKKNSADMYCNIPPYPARSDEASGRQIVPIIAIPPDKEDMNKYWSTYSSNYLWLFDKRQCLNGQRIATITVNEDDEAEVKLRKNIGIEMIGLVHSEGWMALQAEAIELCKKKDVLLTDESDKCPNNMKEIEVALSEGRIKGDKIKDLIKTTEGMKKVYMVHYRFLHNLCVHGNWRETALKNFEDRNNCKLEEVSGKKHSFTTHVLGNLMTKSFKKSVQDISKEQLGKSIRLERPTRVNGRPAIQFCDYIEHPINGENAQYLKQRSQPRYFVVIHGQAVPKNLQIVHDSDCLVSNAKQANLTLDQVIQEVKKTWNENVGPPPLSPPSNIGKNDTSPPLPSLSQQIAPAQVSTSAGDNMQPKTPAPVSTSAGGNMEPKTPAPVSTTATADAAAPANTKSGNDMDDFENEFIPQQKDNNVNDATAGVDGEKGAEKEGDTTVEGGVSYVRTMHLDIVGMSGLKGCPSYEKCRHVYCPKCSAYDNTNSESGRRIKRRKICCVDSRTEAIDKAKLVSLKKSFAKDLGGDVRCKSCYAVHYYWDTMPE